MNYPLLENNIDTPLLILFIVGGVLLVAIIAVVIVFLINKNKKNKKQNGEVWLNALGGKENIDDVSGVGSRVTLLLKDKENIDREKLKTLGVSSVLTMANKIILVVEDQAVKVAEIIREEL